MTQTTPRPWPHPQQMVDSTPCASLLVGLLITPSDSAAVVLGRVVFLGKGRVEC